MFIKVLKKSLVAVTLLVITQVVALAGAQTIDKHMIKPHGQLPAPQYDSKQATKWVKKMLVAHGERPPWDKGDTFGFNHSLYILNFPKSMNPWWISTEQYKHDSRRGYHYYPMEDSLLVFKNGATYHQNWRLPNPPGMMPFFNYNFVVMPWLPLENGAVISYTGEQQLPGDDKHYPTVKLQFIVGATQTPHDYFRLFINPESGKLAGVEYNSTYAPLLDGIGIKAAEFGPGFHVYNTYQQIDELLFVQRYSTYFDNNLAGVHAITDISMKAAYDEVLAHRPGDFEQVTAHPTKRMLQKTANNH